LDDDIDVQIDIKKDIYKLRGTNENPITMKDLLNMFEKMQKQLQKLKKYGCNQFYFYNGIYFSPKKNMWGIEWHSTVRFQIIK
jgi:hypothetical protein